MNGTAAAPDGRSGTNGFGTGVVTGGAGGNGFAGTDGTGAANGGPAGKGGSAGAATATASSAAANAMVDATAEGGVPGSGGRGGNGGVQPDTTTGGDGGSAGVSFTSGNSDLGSAMATATGSGPGQSINATATADTNGGVQGTGDGGAGGSATLQGGNGGNGAVGGVAVATATARGASSSSAANATAGDGGSGGLGGAAVPVRGHVRGVVLTGGKGGDGAPGGDARATAITLDGPNATADASAGNGGGAGGGGVGTNAAGRRTQNGPFGVAGNGGNAIADATSSSSNGGTAAFATANSGNGGAPTAMTGNATSSATATAPKGTADAISQATVGFGTSGVAIATGTATGIGGGVGNRAMARAGGNVRTADGSISSPIPVGALGMVQGQAQAAIAASLPMLKPNTTLNSFASAIGDPLPADVLATSAGKPKVIRSLGVGGAGEQLGLVWLGGLYPAIASGAPATYSSVAEFTFDPKQLAFGDFRVGLQDGQVTGSGFDLLNFQVIENGAVAIQQNFTSVASALSYFDDRVLDLGAISAGMPGLVDLAFDLSLTANQPGDGFAIDLAIADVPEPPSLLLLSIAVGLTLAAVKRGRSRP